MRYLAAVGILFSQIAATFDPDTGRLTVDGAFTIPFDARSDIPESIVLELWDASAEQAGETELAALFEPDGFEGTGALRFGGPYSDLVLHLAGAFDALIGRRVEVRFWQKPDGTRAGSRLWWYAGDPESDTDSAYLGSVAFYATGRVTDDGWEEWSTPAFDLAAGGSIPPAYLSFVDAQAEMYRHWAYTGLDPTLTTRLDAFEVIDLGPALVPAAGCTLASEASACGGAGLCSFGRCIDAMIAGGGVPPIGELRDDYLARRGFELGTFEGGRLPQTLIADFATRLEALRTLDAPARFWSDFGAAVELLRDGHASPPMNDWGAAAYIGVCAHHGEADLLPGAPQLPLVFHAEPGNPVGAQLARGDALVAIDGVAPDAWRALAERLIDYGGDPAGEAVITAPALIDAAARAGSILTFERCAGPAVCDAASVQRFDVDLGVLLGEPLWSGTPPEWRRDYVACDYRFARALSSPEVSDYDYAGFADADGVRSLIINGVPSYWSQGGERWFNTVASALDPAPERLILDQRTGHGGSVDAVDLMVNALVAGPDLYANAMVPWLEQPFDSGMRATLDSCAAGDPQASCGNYFFWEVGQYSDAPRGGAAGTRLAILNAFDVSGNDYTSKMLGYRAGPTRIFGPCPTYGAFGSITSLPPHVGELIGGSFQTGDTVFWSSDGDPNLDFTTGTGVPPDEIVLQRQSDALLGVDTVIAAATAWLQGDAP